MLTRRRLLESLLTTAAGVACGPMSVGDLAGPPASGRPVATVPSRWLFHESSGRFWPVTDFHRWIDRHRTHPLLARAASGLATATDPDRQLRLVLRRCRLQCIEIVPLQAGATGSRRCKVRIQHWRQDVGDLRPFFKALGLARPETRVQLYNRKRPALRLARGDDFLFGRPLAAEPDLDELVGRWRRRHVPTLQCPNCDEPTIFAGYGTKRTSFLGFTPRRTFVCPTCRRLHDAPLDGLDASVAALL